MQSHIGRIPLSTVKLLHQRRPRVEQWGSTVRFCRGPFSSQHYKTVVSSVSSWESSLRYFEAAMLSFFFFFSSFLLFILTVVVETEVSSRGLLALFDTVLLEGFFLLFFFWKCCPHCVSHHENWQVGGVGRFIVYSSPTGYTDEPWFFYGEMRSPGLVFCRLTMRWFCMHGLHDPNCQCWNARQNCTCGLLCSWFCYLSRKGLVLVCASFVMMPSQQFHNWHLTCREKKSQ